MPAAVRFIPSRVDASAVSRVRQSVISLGGNSMNAHSLTEAYTAHLSGFTCQPCLNSSPTTSSGPTRSSRNVFVGLGSERETFSVHPATFRGSGGTAVVKDRYRRIFAGGALDDQFCHVWTEREAFVSLPAVHRSWSVPTVHGWSLDGHCSAKVEQLAMRHE